MTDQISTDETRCTSTDLVVRRLPQDPISTCLTVETYYQSQNFISSNYLLISIYIVPVVYSSTDGNFSVNHMSVKGSPPREVHHPGCNLSWSRQSFVSLTSLTLFSKIVPKGPFFTYSVPFVRILTDQYY